MTHLRLANDLQWARACASWPSPIPRPRPRRGSAKAAGLAYERALAAALPGCQHGVWFEFCDQAGHGWCQTDILLAGRNAVLVLEAKASWVPEAQAKLTGLYLPVVQMALGLPTLGIVVTKRLVPEVRASEASIVSDLASAVEAAKRHQVVVWHWLGREVPGPHLRASPAKSLSLAS